MIVRGSSVKAVGFPDAVPMAVIMIGENWMELPTLHFDAFALGIQCGCYLSSS